MHGQVKADGKALPRTCGAGLAGVPDAWRSRWRTGHGPCTAFHKDKPCSPSLRGGALPVVANPTRVNGGFFESFFFMEKTF
jgi:hypothetical protein